jgi:hypothetical protein
LLIILVILYLVTSAHSKLGTLFTYDSPFSTEILKFMASSGISNAMYIPFLQITHANTVNLDLFKIKNTGLGTDILLVPCSTKDVKNFIEKI